MSKHHKLGASNCERWSNCPGSPNLIERLDAKDVPNEYAAQGSAAHLLAACKLEMQLGNLDNIDWFHNALKNGIKFGEFKFEVDDAMSDGTDLYVDTIIALRDKYDLPASSFFIEHRIVIPGVDAEDGDMFGTADCIVHIPFHNLVILDFKYGVTAVEAAHNKQLKYYALGAWLAMPEWMQRDIENVEVKIVQPRLPVGNPVKSFVYSVDEIIGFHAWLIEAAKATQADDAPLVAGDWCKWCPAQSFCPALKQKVGEICLVEFDEPAPVLPEPQTLSKERICNILDNFPLVKSWFSSIEQYAFQRLLADEAAYDGRYKLVEKRSLRQWADAAETEKVLLPAFGDKIFKKKLISPKQVEEMAKKENATKATQEAIKLLWIKPDNGKTMAKVTDERPALKNSALADFE